MTDAPARRPPGTIVLVADDDPLIRDICQTLLQEEGYRVTVARTGQEARDQVGQTRPAVILLDIMMPVEDGLAACATLQADPGTQAIPVVIMSATDRIAERAAAAGCAPAAILVKPFDLDDLLQVVRQFEE